MSGVTLTDEFWKAHTAFGFSLPEIKDLVVYGFKSAFLHHRQKVELLEQVLGQLKEIRETPADKVTGFAVADIPTEMFSDSARERGAEPVRT
jgi:adenosine deaminase